MGISDLGSPNVKPTDPRRGRAPLIHEAPLHPLGQFFDGLRQTRREHYETRTPDPRKRRAVITITHNEALFFPIWLRYYSRYFAPDDIYVLDHDSTDGSTDGGGFVRIPISHDTFDNLWMVSTVESLQRELLERYDIVLVTDADEIVAPLPELGTLTEYIDRFDEPWVNCLGYEVVHLRAIEPPFDPSLAVMAQRNHWFANDGYDKPALSMQPTSWQPGFHSRRDGEMRLDPDLFLIHLHRLDFDVCRARHRRWADRRWERRDVEQGWGTHNRVVEDGEFERWFYEESAFERIEVAIERIPDEWKGLL
jgi:hypothetical protein